MLFAPSPVLTQGPAAMFPNAAEPAVARQRRVVVDFGYLDPRSPEAQPRLGVELFDGLVVALDRVRIETRGPGNYTWYGQVQGFARSDVALTVVDGYIAGSISIVDAAAGLSAVFEVQSAPGGAQFLRELDSGRFPPDHPPGHGALVAPAQAGTTPAQDHDAPALAASDVAADTGATIDVMVVYSNQTAAAAGAGIAAQIQQAVDRANLAYANSNITPRLRLVHYAPANYDESGDFNTDLDRLTNTGDGYMDGVHALRDAHGADLVSLFIENGAYCGLGWLVSSATYGFTAVNRGCASGNLSFAHELGHNIGARHDPYVDGSNSPYAYGHGYVYVAGLWRTVMAYNNACSDVSKNCTRVPNFSNPNVSYGSPAAPTGTAATHDNARVHNERANAVANFRQAIAVGAPSVSTSAATAIAATGATLNGVVSSNGSATTVTFQYGLTASYGSIATAAQSPLAAGASGTPVSAAIVGLTCSSLYHFRVAGSNSAGPASGNDATFTTAGCASAPSATTLASNANPSVSGSAVTFTATVTGSAPTGSVTFRDGGVLVAGCGAATLSGAGNTRTATCTTSALAVGTHPLTASYPGDGTNAPSASTPLAQQVTATMPITGTLVANPYGTTTVVGGTLVGNDITLTSTVATLQLGGIAGTPGSYAQVDFQGLNLAAGTVLNIRSGAPGQTLIMRNANGAGSAIAGALVAQGGGGAPPPELYVHNPNGIAIAATGNVNAPAGLSLDALGSTWTSGQSLTHAGTVDGGAYLDLYGANVQGGGLFRGNAIGLYTYGNANNPVNGAWFLQNGLRFAPSSGAGVALTLNAFGPAPQVVNLAVTGNATVWMPSAWPAGSLLPPNNAVVAPGAVRAGGVPDPAYGGGSLIVQATGALALVDGPSHDFAFPGGIVLKAGGPLNLNGVTLNQGWTTSGKPFQGIYLEAPGIGSGNGNIRVYGNDVNWVNFSALPSAPVRAYVLARNPDGSASFAPSDGTSPHLNAYSTLSNSAASGGCWTCLVNTAPVNVYDSP